MVTASSGLDAANRGRPTGGIPRLNLKPAHGNYRPGHDRTPSPDPSAPSTVLDRRHQLYAEDSSSEASPRSPACAPPCLRPQQTSAAAKRSDGRGMAGESPAPVTVEKGEGRRGVPTPAATPTPAVAGDCIFKRLAARQWKLSLPPEPEGKKDAGEPPARPKWERGVPNFRSLLGPGSPRHGRSTSHSPTPHRRAPSSSDSSSAASPRAPPKSPHVHFGGVETCPKSGVEKALEIESKLDAILSSKAAKDRISLLREVEVMEKTYTADAAPALQKRDLEAVYARLSKPKQCTAQGKPKLPPKKPTNPQYSDVRSKVYDAPKKKAEEEPPVRKPRSTLKGCLKRSMSASGPIRVSDMAGYHEWAAENGFHAGHGGGGMEAWDQRPADHYAMDWQQPRDPFDLYPPPVDQRLLDRAPLDPGDYYWAADDMQPQRGFDNGYWVEPPMQSPWPPAATTPTLQHYSPHAVGGYPAGGDWARPVGAGGPPGYGRRAEWL